jgi:hypothetical protein
MLVMDKMTLRHAQCLFRFSFPVFTISVLSTHLSHLMRCETGPSSQLSVTALVELVLQISPWTQNNTKVKLFLKILNSYLILLTENTFSNKVIYIVPFKSIQIKNTLLIFMKLYWLILSLNESLRSKFHYSVKSTNIPSSLKLVFTWLNHVIQFYQQIVFQTTLSRFNIIRYWI